jgi:hypothetical protein
LWRRSGDKRERSVSVSSSALNPNSKELFGHILRLSPIFVFQLVGHVAQLLFAIFAPVVTERIGQASVNKSKRSPGRHTE